MAHEAKSEDIRDEKTLLDLRRQYHCAAYNLMVAFISLNVDQIFNKIWLCFTQRLAHEAKSEDVRDEKTLLDLRRQYHCAAYNLMVAFISRTQSELKFYTSFLFEEKQSKV